MAVAVPKFAPKMRATSSTESQDAIEERPTKRQKSERSPQIPGPLTQSAEKGDKTPLVDQKEKASASKVSQIAKPVTEKNEKNENNETRPTEEKTEKKPYFSGLKIILKAPKAANLKAPNKTLLPAPKSTQLQSETPSPKARTSNTNMESNPSTAKNLAKPALPNIPKSSKRSAQMELEESGKSRLAINLNPIAPVNQPSTTKARAAKQAGTKKKGRARRNAAPALGLEMGLSSKSLVADLKNVSEPLLTKLEETPPLEVSESR